LEDLFVRAQFRKHRIGQALFSRVAAIALQEGCFGVMLHVLDWNTTATQFYKKMNATFLDDWRTVCLKADALKDVAIQR
jgi:GNAT superfamily N-acetyltransferase